MGMEKNPEGLLFVISGASGTGKTTLCRALLDFFPGLHFSISYTTRPQRPGDQGGRDYYFISPEEFQKMIDQGEFAEWAEIYGHRYGTSKALLEKFRKESRDVILDIDGQGARQLRDQHWPGIFIFLLPPSLDELERRLSRRQTEGKTALEERMRKAREEMAQALWYDYLILNDDLEKAQKQLQAIILAEHCRRERMMEVLETLFHSS